MVGRFEFPAKAFSAGFQEVSQDMQSSEPRSKHEDMFLQFVAMQSSHSYLVTTARKDIAMLIRACKLMYY